MRNLIFSLPVLASLLTYGCFGNRSNDGKIKIEPFSENKPFAIEIAKERSFYQAEKLNNRLNGMGIGAYIVQHSDDDDGTWYYILSGNIETEEDADIETVRLKEEFNLENLNVVKYSDFSDAVLEFEEQQKTEVRKITSAKPNISENVYDVIEKFPESNALLVERASIINCPENPQKMNGYTPVYQFDTDLPRGVSKEMILKNTVSFTEIIYMDNLYGDRVTIGIGKLRLQTENAMKTAEKYADLILATGNYPTKEKDSISITAWKLLVGYKVVIEPRPNYLRTYLVLVDENEEYLLFSQSTDKTDNELTEIVKTVGTGGGLSNYDEFYNTFYTMPENMVDEDIFIGFTIHKLDRRYANSKGNTKWSKECVGHWAAQGYFYNAKKGVWCYGIYDLLTDDKVRFVESLYSENVKNSSNVDPINVRDVNGYIVYETKIDWSRYTTYKKVTEINFPIRRYLCMVDNTENSWLNREDILKRAESLQF